MVRSASVSLHASGGRLTPPMLFAHSNSWPLQFWQQRRSASINICHQTQHLNFCPCGSSGGQLQSLVLAPPHAWKKIKTLLATPLARLAPLALFLLALLALLAWLAGTPGQQGSIQPNSSSALRFHTFSQLRVLQFNGSACRRLQPLQPSGELSHP